VTALSNFFSLEEMTRTSTGLPNHPGEKELDRLRHNAHCMDGVREVLGHPITVSSGYRSPAVNAKVGGSKTSAHLDGDATDFTCAGFGSPFEVCQAIAGVIKFDQLIQEGTWVHISFAKAMRGQTLTRRVVGGKTRYIPGINR
jgi:hypothetical protein